MGKEILNQVGANENAGELAQTLSRLESALIETLLYFDIFKYPLREEEVLRACRVGLEDWEEGKKSLRGLLAGGMIGEKDGFYFIGAGQGYVERRLKGNALADERMPKARKLSRFIGKFPYVRAVMLSGSLSKNYMEPDSDIDYFIVTEPGRLWIARTLLILYKKVILLNSHRNFCVNYFVDTDHLTIEDQNIFTATEVVYLVPTYNRKIYHSLREHNAWADRTLPNFGRQDTSGCHVHRRSFMARTLEMMLAGKLGDRIDGWFMRRTLKRWETKFPHIDKSRFEVSLRTRKYVSKHHPRDFQKRVLDALAVKIKHFEKEKAVKL